MRLLRDMRASQATLAAIESARSTGVAISTPEPIGLPEYFEGLATAWKDGEVRPTHRRKVPEARWWRTRPDPFELAWPVVEGWLVADPTATAKELMGRLALTIPDAYAGDAQLRTLQRRIKTWRAEKAKDLILGRLRNVTSAELTALQGVEP